MNNEVTLTENDIARLYCFKKDKRYFLLEKDSLSTIEINQAMCEAIEILHQGFSAAKPNNFSSVDQGEINEYVNILKELKYRKLILPEKTNSENLALKCRPHLTIFIQSSYRCNLKCRYCLADYKEHQGKDNKPLSLNEYKKTIDFIFSEYADRQTFLFNFFGGEPLLEFPLIQGLVSYIHEHARKTGIQVNFAINTNGTLLDLEKLNYLNEQGFYLGFSIDGPEHVHNANRPFIGAGSSFQRIMENLDLAKKHFPVQRLKASSMFDRHSTELSATLLFSTQLGLPQVTIEKAKVSPQESGYIKKSDLPILLAEQEKIGQRIFDDLKKRKMDAYVIPFHDLLMLIITKQVVAVRNCEAGENQITISRDGYIYPCYWMDGKHHYAIGSVENGINLEKKQEWLDYIEKEEQRCLHCVAENVCGHGCQITQLFFNETDDINCQLIKHRMEICIWIAKSLEADDVHYFLEQAKRLR